MASWLQMLTGLRITAVNGIDAPTMGEAKVYAGQGTYVLPKREEGRKVSNLSRRWGEARSWRNFRGKGLRR